VIKLRNKNTRLQNRHLVRFLAAGCLFLFFTGCSSAPPLYKETQLLMGTTIEVTIEGEKGRVSEISKIFFRKVKGLEKKFSLYDPESEIIKVNKNGRHALHPMRCRVSPEFFSLLEKSLLCSELTSGAFDITISPLAGLWGFKEQNPVFPGEEEIKDALDRCGYTNIILFPEDSAVSFSRAEVEIDLGAIAKGYIVGEGIKFLKKEGVKAALINAGGDLYCMGAPFNKEGWKVGIRHPRKKNKIITELTLRDKAVATSGDYENFFLYRDRVLSHIIDPGTGRPSETGVVSATVISADAAEADALATALIVMGKDKGLDLINHLVETEAIIISLKEGKFIAAASSGFKGKIKFEL
jgi:thiamine biosynthesis lipoprotein